MVLRKLRFLLAAAAACPSTVLAATLFEDDFDVNTSANYVQNVTSADTKITFAYDYSADGIPASPNGSGSTKGLKFEANIVAPADVQALTVAPIGKSFTGPYTLTFDMWINANGPFPAGGTGSTQYVTAGVGYNGTTVNHGGATGSGAWFAVDGEGGSARDFRAYKNSTEQFAASTQFAAGIVDATDHDNGTAYYAATFPSTNVATVNGGALTAAQGANQTGSAAVGTVGFAWRAVKVVVDGGKAEWSIDGLRIATLDTALGAVPLDGNISLGYMDILTSISANANQSFGLIDNVKVVPEPSSLVMAGLGLAGLALRLRRR